MSVPANKTTVRNLYTTCTVIQGDSRIELAAYKGQADLIVTSPPYADARDKYYDSVHPDDYVEWFLTFHEPFFNALKPSGSFVLNIKDKVMNGIRHRYVWHKTNPMPGRWPTRLRDGWEYCFHLDKTHLQFVLTAAMNVTRVLNWHNDKPRSQTRFTRFGLLAA